MVLGIGISLGSCESAGSGAISGDSALIGILLGGLLIVAGIAFMFISPDWKKPDNTPSDGLNAFGQPYTPPTPSQNIDNKLRCKDCGTELRYDDEKNLYECAYCLVKFSPKDIWWV